jgi:hypothetical protein
MPRSSSKARLAATVLALSSMLALTSCGTLLHPERRGQPAGRLDPGIVLLDAVGLIFFFIPGIIAFAVDFSNGTIYLPPEHSSYAPPPGPEGQELRKVRLSAGELTPRRLEALIQEQTGKSIRLEPGTYQATKLKDLSEFSTALLEQEPATTNVVFPD